MATEAQEREGRVDAARVAHMRELLSKPGGEAEVARYYGPEATDSDEFRAAERQQQRAVQRGREQREAAAQAVVETAARARRSAESRRGGDASQSKLDQANKDLDRNREAIRSQAEKSKGQVQMQSM